MSGSVNSAEPDSGLPCATAQSAKRNPTTSRRCRRLLLGSVLLMAVLGLDGCASTRVLQPFTSDGCSLFPELAKGSACCEIHDLAYWHGGTASARKRADAALRACVLADTGKPLLASVMYRGVRIGGHPLIPSPFRWGYGWGYGHGYASRDAEEQHCVTEKLKIEARTRRLPTGAGESE